MVYQAERRAKQICYNFSHNGKPRDVAENLAMSSGNHVGCAPAMKMWLKSSGHYANVMNRNYRTLACARAECKRATYFVCLYGL